MNYLWNNNTSNYPIKIEKVTFDPLKAGDTAALSPNSSKWYEFTAAEAGEYEFATDSYYYNYNLYMDAYNKEDLNYIYLSDSYDEDVNAVYSGSFTAGQKVYLFMQNYDSYTPLNVKVSKKAAE